MHDMHNLISKKGGFIFSSVAIDEEETCPAFDSSTGQCKIKKVSQTFDLFKDVFCF